MLRQSERQIRAVLFDAVGTLFRSRGTIGEIYRDVAARHGFTASAETLQARFADRIHEYQPTDKNGWHSLVLSVFQGLGPFPEFNSFFEEVYIVFRTGRGWLCYPETRSVLNTLSQGRLRLGVVSNFDSRLGDVLSHLKIDTFFQVVVTPASCGYTKPDARIFLEATQTLGVAPNETLFVGDDPVQDCEAASRAGLRSVLIDRPASGSWPLQAFPTLEGVLSLLRTDDQ